MDTETVRLPDGRNLKLAEATAIVTTYLAEQSAAVDLYDRTNPGPHDEVTALDLLALNALNAFAHVAPMGPMSELWAHRREISTEMTFAGITTADVTTLTDTEVAVETDKVCRVLSVIEATPGFGGPGTRASKLLHRLRPGLVPIWDRFIGEWYGGAEQSWSSYLSAVFRNVRHKPTLSCLKIIQHEHCRFLSLLRVWDILLWKQKFDTQRR